MKKAKQFLLVLLLFSNQYLYSFMQAANIKAVCTAFIGKINTSPV